MPCMNYKYVGIKCMMPLSGLIITKLLFIIATGDFVFITFYNNVLFCIDRVVDVVKKNTVGFQQSKLTL